MKKRQRIVKADAPATAVDPTAADATHRLSGISVKEVSIVDRAANKRKYLLVKEDEQKTADDASKAIPGSPAQPGAAPAPPGPPTTPQPPTLRISPELKAKVAGVLKTVQERVGVITKVLEGSSETPGAAAPQELMDALTQLSQMITQAVTPEAPAAGATSTPPVPPTAKTEEAAATEKAGRKISADRLQQLQTIRDSLNSLIDGAAGDKPAEGAGGEESGEAKPAEGTEKSTVAPNPEITELKNAVSTVAETMGNMMKIFEQQNERIAALSKSRGESRQVDLDTPASLKKADKVIWDMDMARPMKHVD